MRRSDQANFAASIDLAYSGRAICRERGERPNAYRRCFDGQLVVDPYLDGSAPHRSLHPDAWVWKHGQLVRVGELETVRIRKYGRRFRRKDVASMVELIRPLVPIDPMVG